MKITGYILPVAMLSLTACAWVEPSEKADEVTLVKPEHVSGCTKLSTTNTSITHKVGPITRGDETVTGELTILAKNRAVELGGNTIVARGPASEGKMSFDIYQCSE